MTYLIANFVALLLVLLALPTKIASDISYSCAGTRDTIACDECAAFTTEADQQTCVLNCCASKTACPADAHSICAGAHRNCALKCANFRHQRAKVPCHQECNECVRTCRHDAGGGDGSTSANGGCYDGCSMCPHFCQTYAPKNQQKCVQSCAQCVKTCSENDAVCIGVGGADGCGACTGVCGGYAPPHQSACQQNCHGCVSRCEGSADCLFECNTCTLECRNESPNMQMHCQQNCTQAASGK